MKSHLLAPTLSLACLLSLHAAPDTVDPVFAASAGNIFAANHYGGIASVLVQPDGKILFGSNEMPGVVNGNPLQLPLIRVNPDGSVDNTFYADNEQNGSDGGIYFDGQGWPEVHALGLLSDGKIVAAGVMQGVRTGTVASPGTFLRSNSIVRFNGNGTIDTTFQTAGTTAWPTGGLNYIEDVTIQPDDKIIAVGGFGGFRNTSGSPTIFRHGIARLNLDGSVDTSFQINPADFGVPAGASQVRAQFRQAALDSAGRIVVAGYFEWGPAYPVTGSIEVFARLNPDGSRDTSFTPTIPGSVTAFENVVVEPSGNIVVIGLFGQSTTTSWMARLFPNGAPDPSFVLDPSLGVIRSRPLQVDAEGRYLLATRNSPASYQDKLVRVLSDGSLDPTFTATSRYENGVVGTGLGYFGTFTTAPTGKIYSGSYFDHVNEVTTVKLVAFEGDSVPNSPGQLRFASASFSASEAEGILRVAVSRSKGVTGAASATLSLNHISTSGADFGAFSTTVSFADGTGGTQYINIPLTADALVESSETATLTLTNITGATAGAVTTTTITVIDANSPPLITTHPQDLFVPPGSSFSLTVAATSGTYPISYQWYKGVTAIPGATAPIYSVAAADLALHQGDYSVVVSNTNGPSTSATATVTVKNPAILSFTAATATAIENDGTLTLTIQRGGSDVGAVSVDVSLVPGTAIAPGDFTSATTTVSWANGDTASKTVNIALTNDAVAEPAENFQAVLSNFSLDAIAGGVSTVAITLLDDDAGPAITQPLTARRAVTGWNSSLSVGVQSQTTVTYQWYKNGAPIPDSNTATLTFTPVILSDYGIYSVDATNTAGTVSSGPVEFGARPNPLTPVVLDLNISSNQFSGIRARPSGGHLIYGSFTSIPTSTGTLAVQYLIRTGLNGKVDASFLPPFNSTVSHALELPDGSTLVAGSFSNVGVIPTPRNFVRLLADGSVDADFLANLPPTFGTVRDMKVGPDGWVYVVHSAGVDRMTAAGMIDAAFGANVQSSFQTSGGYNYIDFAPGGSFYLSGNLNLISGPSGQTGRRLMRLNPNGTADPTWKYTSAGSMTYFGVQSDGRIVVASTNTTLIRLFPDGASDPSFTTITGVYNTTFTVAADDSIYIANGSSTNTKLRHFLPNGTLDPVFNNGTDPTASNTISSLVALSDGLISVNGSFSAFNGSTASNRPFLLTAESRAIAITGQPLAQTVNPGASPVLQVVASSVLPLTYQWRKNGIALTGETQPSLSLNNVTAAASGDYSVVVSSTAFSATSANAKLTVRDAPALLTTPVGGTSLTGTAISQTVEYVALEPASFAWFRNGVLVPGQETNTLDLPSPTIADSGSYRLTITNGLGSVTTAPILINVIPNPAVLASGFIPPTGGTFPYVGIVVPEASGGAHLYQFGNVITHPSGNYSLPFERVDANGNIVEPFTTTATGVQDVARDPSGNLILMSSSFTIDSVNRRIARIAADGTHDTAFTTAANSVLGNGSINIFPSAAAFDADNRILVSGNSKLVRLNTDGTLHTNLSTGVSGMGIIQKIQVLPSGKILALGNGMMRRLNIDGTQDNTFSLSTPPALVGFIDFETTPSGDILLPYPYSSGQFIYRLSANGALLQTISFSYATYGSITHFLLLADGYMMVAHSTGKRLTRLKPDGSVDPLFDVGTGFNSNIETLAQGNDGSVWVGGGFTTFNGANARGLVRLQGTPVDVIFATQPLALMVDTTTTAQFSVSASAPNAAPLTYLWLKNGSPMTDGGDISGATTTTLSIANAEEADEANYSVIVTNSTTGRAYASAAAALTVLKEPEILTITPNQNLEVGLALTLTANARGAGTLGYQWFRNGDPIIGANSATYSITNSVEENTGSYSVEITNTYGTYISDPIIVNVTLPAGGIRFGSPTLSFGSTVNAILPLPDGRTLVGGAFTSILANSMTYQIDELALLDAEGNLVTSFDLNPNGVINALHLMPDGGILVAGSFNQIGGVNRARVVRLTPSLQVDPSWSVGTGPNNAVYAIEASDTGYYLGGLFTTFNEDPTRAYICHIRADGSLDPFFTPPALNTVYQIRRSGSGIVVGGAFTLLNPVITSNQIGIVKLLSSGAHDTSFTATMVNSTTVFGLIALPDGKWLAGGSFGRLRRFHADGTIDNTWLATANGDINSLALQRDGRILVAGNFTSLAGQTATRLARLNANGTFDSTFAGGAGADSTVQTVALDALGAIHIGGTFSNYRTQARGRYAELNGTPLSLGIAKQPSILTVNPGTSATFTVNALATDSVTYQWRKNGTPLADGGDISGATTATLTIANAEDSDEASYDVVITHNGDATFVTSNSAALTVLGAPEILVAPLAVTTESGLGASFRVLARGVATLNYQWYRGSTALTDGSGISGSNSDTLVLSNLTTTDSGNIRVVVTNGISSTPSTPVPLLVQRHPHGRDGSIVLPVSVNNPIFDILHFPDGGYLIGGNFSNITHTGGSSSRNRLAKLNANGSLDTTVPQISGAATVNVLALAPDGKVYIGGSFTSINTGSGNVTRNRIARLNANLTLDTTFNPIGTGPNSEVLAILPLADGKVLIGGSFTSVNSTAGTAYITRLDETGAIDATFSSGAVNTVFDIAPAIDDTFWVSHASSYGGQSRIVRIGGSGTRVPTFSYPGGMSSTRVVPQADGSVLSLSGNFPFIQKIQSTGALVPGWPNANNFSPSDDMTTAATWSDGRTIVGGAFTFYAGITRNRIASINTDGSLDTTFDPGTGLNGQPNRIRIDATGRIWVVGTFTSYRGLAAPYMIVLNGFSPDPADPYGSFVASLPANQRGENDDFDGDDVPNLIEFVFGTNPGTFNPKPATPSTTALGSVISGLLDPVKTYRIVEVEIPKNTQGVTLTLGASKDLSFTDGATATEFGARTDNGTTETRRYYLTPATNDAPTLFWRLEGTR